jgi:hypothetical protein
MAMSINVTVLQDVTQGSLVDTSLSVEPTGCPEDGGNMLLLNVSGTYTKLSDITFQKTSILWQF